MLNWFNKQETPEDRQNRLRRVVSNSKRYDGLWLNPDYQHYYKNVVLKRLKDLKIMAMTCDVDSQKGINKAIRLIMRYQELQREVEDFFTTQRQAGEIARKQLKEE